MSPVTTRPAHIRDAIDILLEPAAVVELRVLETRRGVVSGYFADPQALEVAAATWSGRGTGIYVTLNPVTPDLLARAANRMKPYARQTTSERDILRLRRLLIDFDPVRRSGISSTDEEHRAALMRTVRVCQWLRARGWPEPLIGDSGNGGHLVPAIDLPNDEPSRRLLNRCLQALNLLFSDGQVLVDVSTAKAAQLWKLPGTLACKGDDLPDRPHRLAVLLQCPDPLRTVTRAQLEQLAALVPTPPQRSILTSSSGEFDLNRWIEDHRLPVVAVGDWNGGRKWILRPCPWNADHIDRAAYIVQFPNGAIAAGCHHNGCAGKDWQALRDLVEPNRARIGPPRPHSGDSGNSGDGETRPWEPPVPFHEFHLPPFPTDALPGWLREYVEASATETQTPPDLPAMVSLGALSATCAKSVEVEIKRGRIEPVNTFSVTSMDPGNRKSAVFRDVVEPLEAFEKSENIHRVGAIKAAEMRLELAKKELERAQAAVKQADPEDRAAREQDVARCAQEVARIRIPSLCRLVADDITSEQLATLLAQQGGRLALMSAEGDIFDIMAGRYAAGSGPNLGVFLKGHSGDDIRVDRVGRPPDYVDRAALTVCLTVQPELLRGLSRHQGFRGRGLLGRFLYALPQSLMGTRDTNPAAMPASVRVVYRENMQALLSQCVTSDLSAELEPERLELEPAARDRLQQFDQWLEPKLAPLGGLAHMTDWAGKLVGAIARLAGLLHMAEHARDRVPWEFRIRRRTVERAIRIGHYLLAHARAAYEQMGTDPEVEAARYVLAWMTAHATETFTVRELFQATRGRFKRVAALQPALTILREHSFIREQVLPPRPGPGRKPSATFEVNPLLAPQNAQNPQNPPERQALRTQPTTPGTQEGTT